VARSNIHLLENSAAASRWATGDVGSATNGKNRTGRAIRCVYRIEEALEGADVIMMLRVQTERLDDPPLSATITFCCTS